MSTAIGFVGLGTMGFPMAVNLKKAGFDVIGYDAFKGVYEKAASAGITMVDTLKEVAERADEAIISMVRDHAQNVEIIFGDGGLLTAQPEGKTIIVMSTLDPETMNELGKKVEDESALKLISAAVSGGASGAQAGTLSIMTAGPEDIVTSCRPYFDAIGSHIFFYGEKPGNSQVAKLVNNMILGITMNAVAEGLKFGRASQPASRRVAQPVAGEYRRQLGGQKLVRRLRVDGRNCLVGLAEGLESDL